MSFPNYLVEAATLAKFLGVDKIENKGEIEKLRQASIDKGTFSRNPDEIEIHPSNVEIYGHMTRDQVEDLLHGYPRFGQLVRVVLDQNGYVISGARRVKAGVIYNNDERQKQKDDPTYEPQFIVLLCEERYVTDDEVKEGIVEFNKNRVKDVLQIYNEIQIMKPDIEARAYERRKNGMKQFSSDSPDLDERENEEKGSTYEILAKQLLIGKGTVYIIDKLGEKYFENNNNAREIVKEIKKGELSRDAGFKKFALMEARDKTTESQKDTDIAKKADMLVNKIELGSLSANQADIDFKKYCTEYDKKQHETKKESEPDDKLIFKPPENKKFNVITLDYSMEQLPKGEDLKAFKSILAKDAAIFWWANANDIREKMNFLHSLKFEVKDIAISSAQDTSGLYFNGCVSFLLLGIRGNLVLSKKYKPYYTFLEDSVDVCDIAESMFPDGMYLNPYHEADRPNWEGPIFYYDDEYHYYKEESTEEKDRLVEEESIDPVEEEKDNCGDIKDREVHTEEGGDKEIIEEEGIEVKEEDNHF